MGNGASREVPGREGKKKVDVSKKKVGRHRDSNLRGQQGGPVN
jgi:hypothetical protein